METAEPTEPPGARSSPQGAPELPARGVEYRPRLRDALVVLVLAVLFRGAYLWEVGRSAEFDLFSMDTEYNLEWARAIATGVWESPWDRLDGAAFFRAPLYSYGLAGFFRVFGEDLYLARVFQLGLGVLSCVLTYFVGTLALGRRVGLGAGCVTAVYWVLAYFEAEFLLPVALVFLALASFALLFVAVRRRSSLLALLAGLVFGLFAITRPNILVFFPVLCLWALALTRAEAFRR